MMKTRVQKWGNSLAVRIPKAFADEVNLSIESEVDLSIHDDKIVLSPVRRRKFRLQELVDQIRDDQLHGETDWGPPVGKEAW
jgi:antitoxin MazE